MTALVTDAPASALADTPASALADLPAIGLPELLQCSALQTRVDRKYVVDPAAADLLTALVPAGTRALEIHGERVFAYTSVYLDTPDLLGYHLAAHRRRRRFKVRTRRYDASGQTYLEVKTRAGAQTVKTRLPGHHLHDGELGPEGAAFVARTLEAAGIAPDLVAAVVPVLRPVLCTRYRRTTLHLAEDASRVTLDRGLTWREPSGGTEIGQPDVVVIETKSAGAASAMDRLLWAHGIRPTRISKYATGLATLAPDLPHNRWARTLRRHF